MIWPQSGQRDTILLRARKKPRAHSDNQAVVVKGMMSSKELEGALGYTSKASLTARVQSNWDKHAIEMKKSTPGHMKQTSNYKGVSADYVSSGMPFDTRSEKVLFVDGQRAKDRLAFSKQLSDDDARTWSVHATTQVATELNRRKKK